MINRTTRVSRIITRLNIGGPAIQAITLSRDLHASNIQTQLIHGRLGQGEGDMTSMLPLDGVDAVYLQELVRPISPVNDIRACWRIYRMLCRSCPDIVHTHMAKAGSLGRLAAIAYNGTVGRRRPARIIHTYHGHVFEGYFGAFSTRVFVGIERWLARHTDRLIAISPAVKQDLLARYRIGREDQVSVIPLGFHLDTLLAVDNASRSAARVALGLPEDTIVVSTVGRLTGIKHHSLFLEVAARLVRMSERFCFLIAGDGELRKTLEAQTAALGLDGHVRFLGWRGDLDRVYGATDVFVLTSRNEGTPVALIEAMAAGVASVSTDVGGVRDVISDSAHGSLVPFGEPQLMAEAVMHYADSAALRQQTGVAAREAVRARYAMTRLRGDIERVYSDLLRNDVLG